ncbi:LLM class flavin-dependent oxidoreductase [Aestuariivirga litoralis]|uniref:LLM class flavin-dependent oxidoreductase n=1 Tax=Aestuariivirga litoralis TaxID=2650924 RepID=UPI0018C646BC|nr:LLM class flavin-dependent oxidoreductase [Aestuariivirga litoralis]MBG1232163.1 LLM class flavin-dependent oxidoreductase [Aestuariivirga litoralis]
MIPLSILDLAPVSEGSTIAIALQNAKHLAQQAERFGYNRYWVAEHHNMAGIASAATSVVIGFVAENTKTIRVGAGGVMLPNHSPMVIAEQFGTLASLYPNRIDLGLGRAPGTDHRTMLALRVDPRASEHFPQDVQELQILLGPLQEGQTIQAVPGTDTNVPLWILGSSTFGAQLAAALGLPYAFASHFAPDQLMPAMDIYRETFQASAQQQTPYAMAGVNVICAETDAEAKRLFTSLQMRFSDMLRGQRGLTKPPIDDIETYWSGPEKAQAQRMLAATFVGSPRTVKEQLEAFVTKTGVNELMVAAMMYDHDARVKSYELLAEVWK